MKRLTGKVALITGGASGLGLAIATRFLEAGARVAVFDLQCEGVPSDVLSIQGDVSRKEDLERAFAEVIAWAGGIDCLVSNAAIQPHGISLSETSPELLERVFRINSNAIFYGLQLAEQHLRPGGSIIHTSSFVGSVGVPNCPSYAASKASVDHLTRIGAIELASRQIRVNAVAPGLILTPAVTQIPDNPEPAFMVERTPLGRAAKTEDVVPVYEFLASDEAAFITGAIIPVDGGVSAGWNQYDLTPPNEWVDGEWKGAGA
ncbi:MAG: SDR family oxidoreductase [Verrucomicrobiota bacterium]